MAAQVDSRDGAALQFLLGTQHEPLNTPPLSSEPSSDFLKNCNRRHPSIEVVFFLNIFGAAGENLEILEDESDRFRRKRPPNFYKPGLVLSSLSSEMSSDFRSNFAIEFAPTSKRYLTLYNRNR